MICLALIFRMSLGPVRTLFPTDKDDDGDDDEGCRPEFDVGRIKKRGQVDSNPIKRDNSDEIQNLQKDDGGNDAPKFVQQGRGKRNHRRAEKPCRFHRVTAAPNRHRELR